MVGQTIVNLNTAIHDRVIELLVDEHRDALVDLGAGDGTLAGRLQKEGFDVTAVDAMVDDFRPAGIEVKAANLNEGIPFGDGQFDVVVSTKVIEHLENPWFFIRELYRVTEPGGVVIISTPNLSNVYVRAWYFLTGRLYNFLDSAYQNIGHITPVYLWNPERVAENNFDVEVATVNTSRSRRRGSCFQLGLGCLGSASSSGCVVVLALRSLPPRRGPTRGLSARASTETLHCKPKGMRCANAAKTSYYAVTEQPRTRRTEQFAIATWLRCPGEVGLP